MFHSNLANFKNLVLGEKETETDLQKLNIRTYVKYLLKEGSIIEKRELLANLRSRLMYEDKKIALIEDS